MKKWILLTIVTLCITLSGCAAGISVGPSEDPYGNAHFGIKHHSIQNE